MFLKVYKKYVQKRNNYNDMINLVKNGQSEINILKNEEKISEGGGCRGEGQRVYKKSARNIHSFWIWKLHNDNNYFLKLYQSINILIELGNGVRKNEVEIERKTVKRREKEKEREQKCKYI